MVGGAAVSLVRGNASAREQGLYYVTRENVRCIVLATSEEEATRFAKEETRFSDIGSEWSAEFVGANVVVLGAK